MLSLLMINIRGITNHKMTELIDTTTELNPWLLCITETHEKYQKVELPNGIDNFVKRRKENDKKGGGLMVILSKDVEGKQLDNQNSDLLYCKLRIKSFDFRLILVYMDVTDQRRNDGIRQELKDILEQIQENEKLIVLGDFNGHLGFLGEQSLNENGRFVIDMMEENNLILLNTDESCIGVNTREENGHKSAIDFVLVNDLMYRTFTGMEIDETKEKFDISDHCLIKVNFKVRRATSNFKSVERIEYYKVSEDLKDRFLEGMEERINEYGRVDSISKFDDIMESNAEAITKRSFIKRYHNGKPDPPWFTRGIRENIKFRKHLSKQWRLSENENDKVRYKNEYKEQKRVVQHLVKEGITKYEKKLTDEIRENKNRNNLWQCINKLRGIDKNKDESILYDEVGNKISESEVGTKIANFWRQIYQKHVNQPHADWTEYKRNTYLERYGNNELVLAQPIENDQVAENFVGWLWRVASQSRSNLAEEDRVRFRQGQEDAVRRYENGEDRTMEWMQKMEFSIENLKAQLAKLKNKKQAGPDKLRNEMYKWLLDSNLCLNCLVSCYNGIQYIGPPSEWKRSKTLMIPKKTNPTPRDLRPIALTNVSYKIYMALVKDKIVSHLADNNGFSNFQSGFTKGRRIEDNLLVISFCVEKSRRDNKPLMVCAIDFEKAFDSIKRDHIINAMIKYRLDPMLIDVVCQLYDGDTTSIYFNNKNIGEIEVTSGIRQGCTGSPLLFIMVLSFIIDKIERSNLGFVCDGIRIPCLFFADDGLLLARGVGELRSMITILENTAAEVGLKINKEKCNILMYGGNSDGRQEICGINIVNQIKYLGVNLGTGWDIFQQHKELKLKSVCRFSNMTYSVIERSCNKLLIGKTYWKSVVLPSILFGSAVICWTNTELDKFQRKENEVWRKVLGAPGYTPLVAMRGDIGVSNILTRDIKSKLRYVQGILVGNNEILKRILGNVISQNFKYGKKLLNYVNMIGINQVNDITNMSESDLSRKIDAWMRGEWRQELNSKSTLSIYNAV